MTAIQKKHPQNYHPAPLDTSDVTLSDDLVNLTEEMARNVHEVWATARISQGWQYGATRNDVEKTHPCLIPYEELPEEEKEYDRRTAVETLKLIRKLGYKIVKE